MAKLYLCEGPIPHPEQSYRVCVFVCVRARACVCAVSLNATTLQLGKCQQRFSTAILNCMWASISKDEILTYLLTYLIIYLLTYLLITYLFS